MGGEEDVEGFSDANAGKVSFELGADNMMMAQSL